VTEEGRIYAVGSNPDAARQAALPVERVILGAFVASGALAGLAARKLAVPMRRGVESLNVAVAAGIILYALARAAGRD